MMHTPVTFVFKEQYSSIGTPNEGSSLELLCYPVEEMKLVRNQQGEEVLSGISLFLTGKDMLSLWPTTVGTFDLSHMRVTVLDRVESRILACSRWYRPGGIVDVGVVYLP